MRLRILVSSFSSKVSPKGICHSPAFNCLGLDWLYSSHIASANAWIWISAADKLCCILNIQLFLFASSLSKFSGLLWTSVKSFQLFWGSTDRLTGVWYFGHLNSKKLSNSVAVTNTVCHINGSNNLLQSCLVNPISLAYFAFLTALSLAVNQTCVKCSITVSGISSLNSSAAKSDFVKYSVPCIPLWSFCQAIGMNGSFSTISIIFLNGMALLLAEFLENTRWVISSPWIILGYVKINDVILCPCGLIESAMILALIFVIY